MKKFCPKCGKTISKGTFCEACNPETLEFKPIKIKLCPTNKYFFRGKWTKFEDLKKVTKTVIKKTLNKNIEVVEGLESYHDLLQKTGMKKDYEVIIIISDNKYTIPISVEVTTSPSFSKVGTDYFEGILQVRNMTKDAKAFVNELIKNTEGLYVNKVVEKEESADYYFVKKKYIGRIAEKIVNEYGAKADFNAQLFTQDKQTSKELYRLNVAVHIPPFRKGDVLLIKEDLILVTSTGKKNTGLELKKKKNLAFKYDPEQNHEYKIIPQQKTKIINTHPATVLSKESYEAIEVENPKKISVEIDQNVTIVEHKGSAFLIK